MFQPYELNGKDQLATIHKDKSQTLRIWHLTEGLEFRLLTMISLNTRLRSLTCVHFVQYQDIFLVTYENGLAEYIKIEMIDIDNEQITRYDLW